MELGENIHLLTKDFPKEEMFNSSQIRRASDSIALNISESILQSKLEFKNFWVTLFVHWLKL